MSPRNPADHDILEHLMDQDRQLAQARELIKTMQYRLDRFEQTEDAARRLAETTLVRVSVNDDMRADARYVLTGRHQHPWEQKASNG